MNQMNDQYDKLWPRLIIIAVVMLVAMTVYEGVKQFLFPGISIWGSHLITICFSTTIATVAGFFILKKQIKLNRALTQKNMESEKLRTALENNVSDLTMALSEVKTLSGMLPICASCKKIRDDKGYWNQIEAYIKKHSEADFTHGICPDCKLKLYPELEFKTEKMT